MADRASPHFVRIVLKAPLPVLVIINLAVPEKCEEFLDILVTDRSPQSHPFDIIHRHQNSSGTTGHPQGIEATGSAQDGPRFNVFYDTKAVIWVDDLLPYLELQCCPRSWCDRQLGVRTLMRPNNSSPSRPFEQAKTHAK